MPLYTASAAFTEWLRALEQRHLADLRVPEMTRALRALSSAYVQRRHKVTAGATMDSAGKRAAFALFYAPLHFLSVAHVLAALEADVPSSIVDIGCGTGAAGVAWAAGAQTRLLGLDRHPWAVEEARWTYRCFRQEGTARVADVTRLPPPARGSGIVAAYVLNELTDAARLQLEEQLLAAAGHGSSVLIIEPISRAVTPWWEQTARRVLAAGGRADEWRFPIELPGILAKFDAAAGLRHNELTSRTLAINLGRK